MGFHGVLPDHEGKGLLTRADHAACNERATPRPYRTVVTNLASLKRPVINALETYQPSQRPLDNIDTKVLTQRS